MTMKSFWCIGYSHWRTTRRWPDFIFWTTATKT